MEQLDIVPDGDLILVVEDKIKLRVHSLILKLTSPVFKAMLGPHFAEGQTQGTSTSPKRVKLPEDYAQAMKVLCQALHSQGDKLRATPPYSSIEQIAVTADKYGCISAVRLIIEAWLSRATIDSTDAGALLHAAYLTDDAGAFWRFTSDLVKSGDDPKNWEGSSHETVMGIIAALRSRTYSVQESVVSALCKSVDGLMDTMHPKNDHYQDYGPGAEPGQSDPYTGDDFEEPGGPLKKCSYAQDYATGHLRTLMSEGVWPPPTGSNVSSDSRVNGRNTLFSLLQSVQKLDIEAVIRRGAEGTLDRECWPYGNWPCNEDYDSSYRIALENLKQAAKVPIALCLDCFKAGGGYRSTCTFDHPWQLNT